MKEVENSSPYKVAFLRKGIAKQQREGSSPIKRMLELALN
jgi:hypothetical protein